MVAPGERRSRARWSAGPPLRAAAGHRQRIRRHWRAAAVGPRAVRIAALDLEELPDLTQGARHRETIVDAVGGARGVCTGRWKRATSHGDDAGKCRPGPTTSCPRHA